MRHPLTLCGLALLTVYGLHVAQHIANGEPEHLFWVCNVACLLVAAGLLARSSHLVSTAFLWALVGSVYWVADMIFSDDIMITSYFTHFGAIAAGLYGVSRLGMSRHAWWLALAAFIVLQLITRAFSPPEQNINVAFTIWGEWDAFFPNYPAYLAFLYAFASAVWYGLGRLLSRSFPSPRVAR